MFLRRLLIPSPSPTERTECIMQRYRIARPVCGLSLVLLVAPALAADLCQAWPSAERDTALHGLAWGLLPQPFPMAWVSCRMHMALAHDQ